MLHMSTQEKNPPGPANNSTYVNQPRRDKNLQASTTCQMVGPHIQLETIILTTCDTPSKLRSSGSRMPVDAHEHNKQPESPEHENIVQYLHTTNNILCFTSMVEWQKESNKKNQIYTEQMPQDNTPGLYHNANTCHAGRIRHSTSSDPAGPNDTMSSSTTGHENQPNEPHTQTFTSSITTRDRQTQQFTPTPPGYTNKEETRNAKQIQRIDNT